MEKEWQPEFYLGRVEPKTLTATEVHANHAPLIDTAGAPQQATTDPRRDGGEWRPPPPPCSPRWCPPVARWVPRPSSLVADVPLVWFRSLRVGHSPCARGARSVLCRWWCSSPTSVTSPPPGPSSRGSSLPAPSSRTPPASTTAAMVGNAYRHARPIPEPLWGNQRHCLVFFSSAE